MINISNFFEKFKKLHQNNSKTRNNIIIVLKEVIDVDIQTNQIEFKNDKIYIKTTPIIRSELFMNKEEIEEKLSLLGVRQKLG